jgi:hypothetical protein
MTKKPPQGNGLSEGHLSLSPWPTKRAVGTNQMAFIAASALSVGQVDAPRKEKGARNSFSRDWIRPAPVCQGPLESLSR